MKLNVDLDCLNSATKYPAIPTYHVMADKGRLVDELRVNFADRLVFLTEKIDGTNARIIMIPRWVLGNDEPMWIIGSREELLTAKGDLISNTKLGIVEALRDVAEGLVIDGDRVQVLYLEVYGSRHLDSWKQYGRGEIGYRMFDLATIPTFLLSWKRELIASWRDDGGQDFAETETLDKFSMETAIPRVPDLGVVVGSELPRTLTDTGRWLENHVSHTFAALGGHEPGRGEGIVLRTQDRFLIAKARLEDYERTLRIRTP